MYCQKERRPNRTFPSNGAVEMKEKHQRYREPGEDNIFGVTLPYPKVDSSKLESQEEYRKRMKEEVPLTEEEIEWAMSLLHTTREEVLKLYRTSPSNYWKIIDKEAKEVVKTISDDD